MAEARRQGADGRLAFAMATGLTNGQAAAAAGISVRTAQRRLKDPDFCRQIQETRASMLDACVGKLANAALDAADTLQTLIKRSESEKTKLAAARAILELFPKLQQLQEFEQRLAALEARLEETVQ